MLPMAATSLLPDHWTAPNVNPRTSCFCENQPRMRIGAIARTDAAESSAQKSPSGLENDAIILVSGAALTLVRLSVQKASFHDRIIDNNIVDAIPGTAIGVS